MRVEEADAVGARRILVYGVTGSGKTTLAHALAESRGLPFVAVDDLTWEPGWVAVPEAEQRRRVSRVCAEPAWVLDSAYSTWLNVPLARADLVVGLDYPRWFSLQRLIRRTLARIVDRREICHGNVETLAGRCRVTRSWRGISGLSPASGPGCERGRRARNHPGSSGSGQPPPRRPGSRR